MTVKSWTDRLYGTDTGLLTVKIQYIKVRRLTRTTSGSRVIACPSIILIGAKLPFLSMVFTRVSVPSSHIWATSSPALTKPPCSIVRTDRSNWWSSKLCASLKLKYGGLTGLFRRSNMYDWTPRFSISLMAFSMSIAAVLHIGEREKGPQAPWLGKKKFSFTC